MSELTTVILGYVTDLKNKENSLEIKYDKELAIIRNMNISNQTFSSLAVATGTGGIATGITVIGLPVSIGLGVAATIFGTVSFVLTGVG